MRNKAKLAGSDDESAEGATTIVSGSIRTSDESEALKVELDFSSGRVTMHADGNEIGSWPSDAVSINAIDSITFSFVAEGDQLVFVPDDPGAFGIVPLVEADDEPEGKRSRRKAKKTAAKEEKTPGRSKSKSVKPAKTKSVKPAKTKSVKPAKTKSVKTTAKVSRSASKKGGKATQGKSNTTGETTNKVSAARTSIGVIASAVAKAPARRKRSKIAASGETKTSMWIRTLDTARRHGFFGLDRVQVNEDLRGQVHEHSWDHRVAPKAGPGKHICTICGRIRR